MPFLPRLAALLATRTAVVKVAALVVVFFTFSFAAGGRAATAEGDLFEQGLNVGGSPHQEETLLTIFYNGSTNGEIHPCPT